VVEAYLPRVGQLVSGTVKKAARESVIVDLGNNVGAARPRKPDSARRFASATVGAPRRSAPARGRN
jgi:hypothetical protein